jgi:DNA-binding Lrp family transcriptional regulator
MYLRRRAGYVELDRTDHAIVGELQKNARLSNKELAARVGIAASTFSERLKRLEDAGVLTGYHANVAPAALGIGMEAIVAVRLGRHDRRQVASFWEHATRMPEVVDIYHVAGANDFLVHVLVRDTDHLRELALSGFTSRPEVGHIETALVFQHERRETWPDYVAAGDAS